MSLTSLKHTFKWKQRGKVFESQVPFCGEKASESWLFSMSVHSEFQQLQAIPNSNSHCHLSPRAHLHLLGMLRFMSDKPTKLAHSFSFCSCVYFCLYSPFNCISFHKFSPQLWFFFLLFFRSYFCLVGLFYCISLYESLLQPWYNPQWLTGLKTTINQLTLPLTFQSLQTSNIFKSNEFLFPVVS